MYTTLEKARPGLKDGIDSVVSTGAAAAIIAFGSPLFREKGEDLSVYPWVNDAPEISFSSNFVTSNAIVATVAGVALAAVNFATDHATTFAALVAALEAVPGVSVAASDAVARTITLNYAVGDVKTSLSVSFAVTGGASQATATVRAGTTRVLGGVALRTAKEVVLDGGAYKMEYDVTDPVNVITVGRVWVNTADAVNSFAKAGITAAGAWTDDLTAAYLTPFTFLSSTSTADLAKLKVDELSA